MVGGTGLHVRAEVRLGAYKQCESSDTLGLVTRTARPRHLPHGPRLAPHRRPTQRIAVRTSKRPALCATTASAAGGDGGDSTSTGRPALASAKSETTNPSGETAATRRKKLRAVSA